MKTVGLLIHGLVLGGLNLVGVAVGAMLHSACLPTSAQAYVVLPVALVFSVATFAAWSALAGMLWPNRMRLRRMTQLIWCWVLALVWGTAMFAPIHYLMWGDLAAMRHMVALWSYQMPINLFAVAIAYLAVSQKRTRGVPLA